MDIFYKDAVNSGTLFVFTLPQVKGEAKLFFFNSPAPKGTTFLPGVIITAVNYTQQTNTQFQQSLDNVIYVYSFGDQMGNVSIGGLAFPRQCDNTVNGITELIEFYRDNRVSRNVERVRVTFANEVIEGFLVSLAITTADVSSGVHSFQMLLRTVPLAFDKRSSLVSSSLDGLLLDTAVNDYVSDTALSGANVETAIA